MRFPTVGTFERTYIRTFFANKANLHKFLNSQKKNKRNVILGLCSKKLYEGLFFAVAKKLGTNANHSPRL